MRTFGYTQIVGPPDAVPGGKIEMDLFRCFHCQKIVTFAPGEMPEDAGGLCKVCDQLICKVCYGIPRCDPFERKLDRIESHNKALQSYGV